MKRPTLIQTRLTFVGALMTVAMLRVTGAETNTNAASAQWEPEIQAFEAADKTNPPPREPILFLGSSSIRLWKSLAQDFPGYKVINRGFGGSHIADSAAFAERIVLPYKPRMIVFYAGDNDVATGKAPEELSADFKTLVEKVESALPETRIAFISIKPSPGRWHLAEKVRDANQLIKAYCGQKKQLVYIDVFNPMLGPDGMPRQELFAADNLHMNRNGYGLWTKLVEPHLR